MELNSEYLTERLEIRILEAHFDLAKKLLNYVKKNQEHFYFMYGFVDYDSVEEMYDFLKRRKLANNPFYGLFLKGSDELIGSISMTGYDEKNGIVFCLSSPFGGFGFLRPQSARRQTARPVAVRKYIARRRGRRRGIFPAQENKVWEIRRCRFQIG